MTAPYAPTSPTSAEAARLIDPLSNHLRAAVFDFIVGRGARGATDDEMQRGIPMKHQTQGPRRLELKRHGLIVDSGLRRPTGSGRPAVVWVAARLVEADEHGQRRLF
jgi:hypothetical protein